MLQLLCNCCWIVLYTVHVTAFSLGGGGVFSSHVVDLHFTYLLVVTYPTKYI